MLNKAISSGRPTGYRTNNSFPQRQGAHGGWDRSAGDARSSVAPDPNLIFLRGPCSLFSCFVIFLWTIELENFEQGPCHVFVYILVAEEKYIT